MRKHAWILNLPFCVVWILLYFYYFRGLKDLELDTPSIEKRFAYSFLQQLIRYVDEAHQYILEFGNNFTIIKLFDKDCQK